MNRRHIKLPTYLRPRSPHGAISGSKSDCKCTTVDDTKNGRSTSRKTKQKTELTELRFYIPFDTKNRHFFLLSQALSLVLKKLHARHHPALKRIRTILIAPRPTWGKRCKKIQIPCKTLQLLVYFKYERTSVYNK